MAKVSVRPFSVTRIVGAAERKEPAIHITNPGSSPLFVSVLCRRGGQIIGPAKPVVRTLGANSSLISTYAKPRRSGDLSDDEDEIVVVSSSDRNMLRAALRGSGGGGSRSGAVSWSAVRVPRSARAGQQTAKRAGKQPTSASQRPARPRFQPTPEWQRQVKEPKTANSAPVVGPRRRRTVPPAATGGVGPPGPPPPPPPPPGRPPRREPPPADPGGGRQAYGLLDCPDVVVVDQEFELVAGLTEDPEDAELNDAMTIFPEDAVVDVTVCAPGCVLRPGETWRQSLPVRADRPLPAVTVHLTVPASERYRPSRTIKAVYTVPGRTLGLAVRSFAVARTEADVGRTALPEPARTATVSPPAGPRNDLEIIIHTPCFGELSWDYTSANPDVVRPDAPIAKQIGDDASEFAKYLLRRVDDKASDTDLAEAVNGFGRMIAATIPAPVWEALRTVAAAAPAGKPPNVMILSEEPRIPWELAATEPPLRPDAEGGQHAAPVLGAQVRIGRWALASPRPTSPPPSKLTVEQMAVVSGRYRGRKRIKKAEEEAKCLRGKYHAADVSAELRAVTNCLRGQPPAEAIHFALHGHYSPEDRRQDGLLLVDGMVLEPAAVAGHTLDRRADRRPLVFLNACQVGTGEAVLGVYTGMGGAFLIAGAAAVIAPLWSVDDDQASSVALSFYEQVFEQGVSPAEFVRRLRAGFRHDADVVDATPLAYQFFGHPQLEVVRQDAPS